jgi:hypothetical protein
MIASLATSLNYTKKIKNPARLDEIKLKKKKKKMVYSHI